MKTGDQHTATIEITPQLVQDFAKVSGDFNPVHLDAEYAARTPFKKPIAHGVLTNALLSGVMGTKFPGPGTILIEQTLKFIRPIFVGDTITLEITVDKLREDKPIATLMCRVRNGSGEVSLEGPTTVRLAR